MPLTNLQNKPIIVGSPIEIEFAVNEIRKEIANIPWVSHPYFIAQRFTESKNGKNFIYPETYAPEKPGSRNYKRLTPDNDYSGMCFFMVGASKPGQEDFLIYPVAVIVSANLQLIDNPKLNNGLFTQELIADVRNKIKSASPGFDFQVKVVAETRDLREVYREFVLGDLEQYNRAPMQCFRIDLEVTVMVPLGGVNCF